MPPRRSTKEVPAPEAKTADALRKQLDDEAKAAIETAKTGEEPPRASVPSPAPASPEGATISPDAAIDARQEREGGKAPSDGKGAKGTKTREVSHPRFAHMGMESWLIVRELAGGYSPGSFFDNTQVSFEEADRAIAEIVANGWVLQTVEVPGYTAQGIRFVYQFIRAERATDEQRQQAFSEVRHISRTLTTYVGVNAITGYQADVILTSLLQEGWRVRYTRTLAPDGLGLPFVWFLVR